MHDSESLRMQPVFRRAILLFATFIMSVLLVGTARAATTCKVETDKLNLRSTPSTSASVLAELPKGAELEVIGTEPEWYKVKYKEQTGYVNVKHVTLGGAANASNAASATKAATETRSAATGTALTPPGKKRTDITLKEGDSGEDVLDVQDALRKKGYFKDGLSSEFGAQTKKALILFQTKNDLSATGIADKETLKALYGKRSDRPAVTEYDYSEYIEMDEPTDSKAAEEKAVPSGDVEQTLVNKDVRLVDWWNGEIQRVLPRGKIATIIDVETGLSFRIQRLGGSNHADCEPLTAEDAAIMKKARGGEWGWTARSIYIVIDGQSYAAAMNGMPHGGQNITNNGFEGHFCVHFLNSRTHRTNKKNPDMQNKLMEAFEAAGDR